jgi:type I restriction enzyme, R subunit
MYDKVQTCWKNEIKKLVGEIAGTKDPGQKASLQRRLDYMRAVEMAVIVSEEADEEKKFTRQRLDIKPHRDKINAIDKNGHDIEFRFKDPKDKLQLVFVCAMWLTGFDAPTVSTLYLDKPMKDHTLMQTIARANRVTSYVINDVTKKNGEIVDYYNVFRNIKKALKDYALGAPDKPEEPVQEKSNLFTLLDDALKQGSAFCDTHDICMQGILNSGETFKKVGLFQSFANALLEKDEIWKEFKVYENTITSLYEACKPEILGHNFRPLISVFQYLRGVVDGIIGESDIEGVKQRISDLLDQSIITANEGIFFKSKALDNQITKGRVLDLSKLDFDKLKVDFKEAEYKNIEIADLRGFIEKKLEVMLQENSTRGDFAQRLQAIIDKYNSGGSTTEDYYDELVRSAENLKAEDERPIKEGLTKDELELFDILKKEPMTKAEEIKIKNAARHLLRRIKEEQPPVLIQDWFKNTQTRLRVKTAVEEVLDKDLPETYDKALFKEKSTKVFDLIFDYASKGLKWAA